MTRYAAVGNDGMRPVVWGLGATEEEAEADARRWLAEVGAADEVACVEVTERQARLIDAGEVDCTSLGIAVPMTRKCCVECAAILCDCGAYHGTDGTIAVESDRGPLYVFAQSPEAVDQGDDECDVRSQYALVDAEVDRLAERCERCERMDDEDGAE